MFFVSQVVYRILANRSPRLLFPQRAQTPQLLLGDLAYISTKAQTPRLVLGDPASISTKGSDPPACIRRPGVYLYKGLRLPGLY